MIKWLQLKQVLCNPRFLLFTIVIPAFWYIMMLNMTPAHVDLNYGIFIIACLWGIGGNSVVTFAKRINSGRQYYAFKAKTSYYSLGHYLFDQVLLQLILNLLIIAVNIGLGSISNRLPLTNKLIVFGLLLSCAGIYLSIIGFILGMSVQAETLDAMDFPIMCCVMLLVSPLDLFWQNGFVKHLVDFQKLFPFHYIYNVLNDLLAGKALLEDIVLFALTFIITLIPLLVIGWWQNHRGKINVS
ncbi:ABC transporter [Lactobacillus sp. ESL0677]|uniref:ABC transporter n=1 Tax=Lactobacillus sp. ESL0677 TaxID=2983208 RepID=UPI0023F66723|nr:ABC transporter [Lactobacillus sp. ESL0677]WEV36692.1 ABC transporter [Lactobacillus sp. ESL0677]